MQEIDVDLRINGSKMTVSVAPCATLLDVLREAASVPGMHGECRQGTCGACTVIMDSRHILACLALAIQCTGRDLTTLGPRSQRQGCTDKYVPLNSRCPTGELTAQDAAPAPVLERINGAPCTCGGCDAVTGQYGGLIA